MAGDEESQGSTGDGGGGGEASALGEKRPGRSGSASGGSAVPRGGRLSAIFSGASANTPQSGSSSSPHTGPRSRKPSQHPTGRRMFASRLSLTARPIDWDATNLLALCVRFRHPRLCTVFGGISLAGSVPALVREYGAGGTLEALIEATVRWNRAQTKTEHRRTQTHPVFLAPTSSLSSDPRLPFSPPPQERRSRELEFQDAAGILTGLAEAGLYLHQAKPPCVAELHPRAVVLTADLLPKVCLRLKAAAEGAPQQERTVWCVRGERALPCPPKRKQKRAHRGGRGHRFAPPQRGRGDDLPLSLLIASHRIAFVSRLLPLLLVVALPPLRRTAPEVLNGTAPSPASDVYAFALILHAVFCRGVPFSDLRAAGEPLGSVLRSVAEFDLRLAFPESSFPKPLREVAIDCWHRNAAKRATFAEAAKLLAAAIEAARPELARPESLREALEMRREAARALMAELLDAPDEEALARMAAAILEKVVDNVQAVAVATLSRKAPVDPSSAAETTAASFATGGAALPSPTQQQQPRPEDVIAPKLIVSAADDDAEEALAVALRPSLFAAGPRGFAGPSPAAASSIATLLKSDRKDPVTSSSAGGGGVSAGNGLSAFVDWSAASRLLPDTPAGTRRHAFSVLLRGGVNQAEIVGFLVVVWGASTIPYEAKTEELLIEEFATAVGKAVYRRVDSPPVCFSRRIARAHSPLRPLPLLPRRLSCCHWAPT